MIQTKSCADWMQKRVFGSSRLFVAHGRVSPTWWREEWMAQSWVLDDAEVGSLLGAA